jgi:hypothetical protein
MSVVFGVRAYEVAQKAPRTAKNKYDQRQSRYYSNLGLSSPASQPALTV